MLSYKAPPRCCTASTKQTYVLSYKGTMDAVDDESDDDVTRQMHGRQRTNRARTRILPVTPVRDGRPRKRHHSAPAAEPGGGLAAATTVTRRSMLSLPAGRRSAPPWLGESTTRGRRGSSLGRGSPSRSPMGASRSPMGAVAMMAVAAGAFSVACGSPISTVVQAGAFARAAGLVAENVMDTMGVSSPSHTQAMSEVRCPPPASARCPHAC